MVKVNTCRWTETKRCKPVGPRAPRRSPSPPVEMSAAIAALASLITTGAPTGEEPDVSLLILCREGSLSKLLGGELRCRVCDRERRRQLGDIFHCDLDSGKPRGNRVLSTGDALVLSMRTKGIRRMFSIESNNIFMACCRKKMSTLR